ncbi:hypothetical protein SAMN05421797_109113 [Maribacter ulvicola]|uniref:Uncharacterized protein n=1 Tax=Maribacter ulvicola TaxID=228959 RepID=A0A1N6ZTF3_9FLAO|nr:hypothetical protein SAMN05421797_109113 [Maribacter ulvicola]
MLKPLRYIENNCFIDFPEGIKFLNTANFLKLLTFGFNLLLVLFIMSIMKVNKII